MSSALNDLLVTDAELDLVARREFDGDDFVLSGLAALAQMVDDDPIPDLQVEATPVRLAEGSQISHAHRGGFALAATVVLVLSSSGVAAAMSGDPLAPFHYVAKRVLELGPHGDSQLPGWDIDGHGQIGTVRSAGIGHAQTIRVPGLAVDLIVTSHRDSGVLYDHQRHPGELHGPGAVGPPGSPVSGGRTSGGERSHAGGGRAPAYPRRPGRSQGGTPVSPIMPTDPRHGHSGGTGMSTRPGVINTTTWVAPRPPAMTRQVHTGDETQALSRVTSAAPNGKRSSGSADAATTVKDAATHARAAL